MSGSDNSQFKSKEAGLMAIAHVFDCPPPGVADDWTMPQNWDQFSRQDHANWDLLLERQSKALEGLACSAFLAGLDLLRLAKPGIPNFDELNEHLEKSTGWQVVPVPGVIPNEPFFRHLSERRFPAANFLRPSDSIDYSEEPDMFHDLFGHLPMLTDPDFADYMVAYGKAGLRAQKLGASDFLARLWLHTVEFGLIKEGGELRGFGAGLLSSFSETVHALTAPNVRRIEFDLARVMRSDYLFDEFQKTYFVIESFEDLLRITSETDFQPIYEQAAALPLLEPDAAHPSDVAVSLRNR